MHCIINLKNVNSLNTETMFHASRHLMKIAKMMIFYHLIYLV